MSTIDYSKFYDSLNRVKEKYADYQEMDERPELRDSDKDSIKESLVKRFEVCVDTSWKYLKRYLHEQGLTDVGDLPKPIFRLASKNGLISKESLENWTMYIEVRNNLSHDYDGKKEMKALDSIENFIEDASGLYNTIAMQK